MSAGAGLSKIETTPLSLGPEQIHWYAVQTRARHEKRVADRFREQGLPIFLPLISETRRWSDRKKVVELPLFGCYVFVKVAASREERLRVCCVDGGPPNRWRKR